jgi:tellurium resistance protein TerZ
MGISLSKGQSISLDKPSGGSLTKVVMGLGWDVAKKRGFLGRMVDGDPIDLDASCVLFDFNNRRVDAIWFKQLTSKDGSILHTGDNRTGAGDGDDEQIKVNLSAVPAEVKTLFFVVNSFTGETFAKIDNAMCRLVDESTGVEIARYNLSSAGGSHTAQIMAKVVRSGNGWELQAIGQVANGRTFDDLMPEMILNL